jgi:hypothetical protein
MHGGVQVTSGTCGATPGGSDVVIANNVFVDGPDGHVIQMGESAVHFFIVNNTFDNNTDRAAAGNFIVLWNLTANPTRDGVIANNLFTRANAAAVTASCTNSISDAVMHPVVYVHDSMSGSGAWGNMLGPCDSHTSSCWGDYDPAHGTNTGFSCTSQGDYTDGAGYHDGCPGNNYADANRATSARACRAAWARARRGSPTDPTRTTARSCAITACSPAAPPSVAEIRATFRPPTGTAPRERPTLGAY